MNRFERIVVAGSVGFDHIMSLPGEFSDWIMSDKIHQLNVSFTVKTLRVEFGGTGGNCAYTLGLLGKKPALVGYLGMDGSGYADHLALSGVDTRELKIDRSKLSASGSVMTDLKDNQIWSYYPGPLTRMKEINLKKIVVPERDITALMPSEPKSFVKHLKELVKMKASFMFDPAFFIPNLTVKELLLGIDHGEIIIGNDYEIALMERKIGRPIRKGLGAKQIMVRTLGEKGSEIYQGTKKLKIDCARVKKVIDPTGAGDAYRAGFLAGYTEGKSLAECGRMAAVTAAYTVEKYGTQTHRFNRQQFEKRLKKGI